LLQGFHAGDNFGKLALAQKLSLCLQLQLFQASANKSGDLTQQKSRGS
jgi:hypothetical protein